MRRSTVLAILVAAVLSASLAAGEPLFTENFDAEMPEIGRDRQFETGLTLKHAAQYPGWSKQGTMPVHFVLQSPGDWALMLFSHQPNENILTLDRPFTANDKGHTYSILCDVGPGVYAMPSQTTRQGDEIILELVRADGSVLQRFPIQIDPWDGAGDYSSRLLSYDGDGSGNLVFRISPGGNDGRFYGAIDQLQVFASVDQAEKAQAAREAAERERIARMPPAMKKKRVAMREQRKLRARFSEVFDRLSDKKPQHIGETLLAANQDTVFDAVAGNAMALEFEIDPQESRWVQISVLRSPEAQEETIIRFYNFDRRISIWYATQSQLVLDTTHSSQSPNVQIHPPENAMISFRGIKMPGEGVLPAEPLKLRVLVENNSVGVVANGRVFMSARVDPVRADSIGVALRACGQDAVLKSLKAWRLGPEQE